MLQAKTLSGGAEDDGGKQELSFLPCYPAHTVCAHKQFDCIGICLFIFLDSVAKNSEKKVGMTAVTNACSHALVFFGRLYLRGFLL